MKACVVPSHPEPAPLAATPDGVSVRNETIMAGRAIAWMKGA